ncbi:hypothetical protein [Pragia fontium]|uniref:Uncharacterized protein n=1 Tax=Pragia fontium DSM 5563 = ATCC 49100 TaxID=1122977 RepID=A0AAJ4W7D1_9GAMM|nr:hypothetical protein [Pragia fontium]SFB95945.1 hypothetical protein SAMN02745723_10136 [Pragia fontium DSM 5563 = ATCC 49100]
MRDLFYNITNYQGDKIFNDELVPWLDANERDFSNFIKKVSNLTIDVNNVAHISDETSWQLYALSRVLDCLTQCFQYKDRVAINSKEPFISQEQYISFAQRLGLSIKTPEVFNPFFYEIIRAESGKPNFDILEICYPALMLDHLLINRGGVVISMSPSEYNIDLVNNAEIYWAYTRSHRASNDLSHGWGSNSQWRTGFRFDFECSNGFIYNSQGSVDLNLTSDSTFQILQEDSLLLFEARELTMYRHFITSTRDDDDLFPYNYKFFDAKDENLELL